MGDADIIHGDGIAGLLALPAGSVALVLTDPPWGVTKATWDRQLNWNAWWAAIDHALAPDGVACVFASVKLAAVLVPPAPRPFSYDLVWKKNRASGHLNAKRAPLRAHETVLVFGAAGRYAPQYTSDHRPMNAATRRSRSSLYGTQLTTSSNAGTTRRYATSVLDVPVLPNIGRQRRHPTQKPLELLRWLVRAYAPAGSLVVDPTCGSGATVLAARAEGRRGIGWELHEPYATAAAAWLAEAIAAGAH